MTMVIATHEMGFAGDIADRVCFLDQGRRSDRPPSRHPSSHARASSSTASSSLVAWAATSWRREPMTWGAMS